MLALHNHIILIGFKHTGKSAIGKCLAQVLQAPYIDLDHKIEEMYEDETGIKSTCRDIMQEKQEKYFRLLEIKTLSQTINSQQSIISLGGGTPMHAENQRLIKSSILVHVTAERGTVFERILMSGRPAFFNPEENLLESFNNLWNQREKVYVKIRDISVENNGKIEDAIARIIGLLNLKESVNE